MVTLAVLAAALLCGCGSRDERHYELAIRHKNSGDYDRAISELQAAVAANPRFAKGYNQLGLIYWKVGLYDKAAEQFKRAGETDHSYGTAYYNLGVLLQSHLGKPADAMIAYRRYLELSPDGDKAEVVRRIVRELESRPEVSAAVSESLDGRLATARDFESAGDYERSVELYEKILAAEPRAASRAHLEAARIYEQRLNKPQGALAHYQSYLDANINAPDAAEVMARVGKLRESLIRATPSAEEVREKLSLAETLLARKEVGGARELLEKLVAVYPDREDIHDLLAEVLMAAGDLQGAEREYEWLRSRQADFAYSGQLLSLYKRLGEEFLKRGAYAEAEERFAKACGLAPNDGSLRWMYARALTGGGKFQKAMDEAAIARSLSPAEVGGAALAEIYLASARNLISSSQYDRAAEALGEVRRLAPDLDISADMARFYEERAISRYREGKLSSAELDYQKALSINPSRMRARRELAKIYEQLGQYERAIGELERCAGSGGDEGAAALKEIARIYESYRLDTAKATSYYKRYLASRPRAADSMEIEKKVKAVEKEKEKIAEYEKAVKKKPSSAPDHYNLGVLLQRQGKYREAIDAYRRAVVIEPGNAQAHFNLGYSYDRLKMYEEAIAEYNKAIQLKPQYLKAYSNLAAIYREKKWYGRAIAAFQKALEIDPNYAHAHLGLGTVYADGLKDRQRALNHYKQYLRLEPGGTYAPQVRAWMRGKE